MNVPNDEIDISSDEGMSSLLTENPVRRQATERLRQKISSIASEVSREATWMRRQSWKSGFVGALAASLLLIASFWGWEWFTGGKDPYDIVVQESREAYKRLILDGELQKAANFSRKNALKWIADDNPLVPAGSVPGMGKFYLDTGSVPEISGQSIARMIYKINNLTFLVTVLREDDTSDYPDVLQNGWVINPGDSFQSVVWSKGSYIYALSGEASVDRLVSFSKYLSP